MARKWLSAWRLNCTEQEPGQRPYRRIPTLIWVAYLSFASPLIAAQHFIPQRNLDPASANIVLDSSFQEDAWMVYTYDIEVDGSVVDARIRSSNGVPAVEAAVLEKVNSMRFQPATLDGQPVRASADPATFTWILDRPREQSPEFRQIYQQAWSLFNQQDYDGAREQAGELRKLPGRNALEESKYRILAASLASRRQDSTAELQHLYRVVELESLARDNHFRNLYVETDTYGLILERVHALQLERMMLADAAQTLARIQAHGSADIAQRAAAAFAEVERQFRAQPDVRVPGELVPIYPDGPGAWKTGLSRIKFSIKAVSGKIDAVFLTCGGVGRHLRYPSGEPWIAPTGQGPCTLDITGLPGTRFALHQYESN